MAHNDERSVQLDRIRIKILRELCRDPRQPVARIARSVGIKAQTTAQHIKALCKPHGVIMTIKPMLNLHLLGCHATLVQWGLKDSSPTAEDRAWSFFASHPAVILTFQTRDTSRFTTFLAADDDQELHDIITTMKKSLPGIIDELHTQMVIDWRMPHALPERLFTEMLSRRSRKRASSPQNSRHSRPGVNKP